MDEQKRWRRTPMRSFALGATVGAAGTIATLRRLRRARGARTMAGLTAFEDAPCFLEQVGAEPEPVRDPAEAT